MSDPLAALAAAAAISAAVSAARASGKADAAREGVHEVKAALDKIAPRALRQPRGATPARRNAHRRKG